MTFSGSDSIGRALAVEISTSGYRVSGTMRTRFDRVSDVLNNLDRSHAIIEMATVRELYDPGRGQRVASAMVPLDEILFLVADLSSERSADAIVVPKRPVQASVALPPFRLSGTIFVPESVESVATAITMSPDAFIPMVDVTVTCWIRAELNGSYPVVAFARRKPHVLSFEAGGVDPMPRPAAGPGWS